MESNVEKQFPMYSGEMTHENISAVFAGAGDFNYRPLRCGEFLLHTYAIDGLTSGRDISDYIFKPIAGQVKGDSMEALFDSARDGSIYNSVASVCENLEDIAIKLVNGFCVVLFPGVGAIAFEVKTGEKRSIFFLSLKML